MTDVVHFLSDDNGKSCALRSRGRLGFARLRVGAEKIAHRSTLVGALFS
jgi:hypothetical protein